MTIAVELTRAVDGPEVLAAPAAGGVEGKLSDDGCELTVSADDCETVSHLLEEWAAERELPFSPIQVDGCSFVLAPPAG
ncbi:MAG TPA: hypothetical protein VLJ76_04395 [Gaiellaceae bacterium]|nr:hypothetical protein [Gaiellaceae bacterium]